MAGAYFAIFLSVNEIDWIKIGAGYNAEILSDDYVREGSDRYRPAFTGSFVGVACNDLSGAGIWAKFNIFRISRVIIVRFRFYGFGGFV